MAHGAEAHGWAWLAALGIGWALAGCASKPVLIGDPGTPPTPDPVVLAAALGEWTQAPIALDPGTEWLISDACRTSTAGPTYVGDLQLAVADVRGAGHATAIFADEDRVAECRLVIDATEALSVRIVNRDAIVIDRKIRGGDLRIGTLDVVRIAVGPGPGERSVLIGRAGSRIKAVIAILGDGTEVAASLDRGWFSAWWPGSDTPMVVAALDAQHEVIATAEP